MSLKHSSTSFADRYPIRQRSLLYGLLCQRFKTATRAIFIDVPASLPYELATSYDLDVFFFNSLSVVQKFGPWCFDTSKATSEVYKHNYILGAEDVDWHTNQSSKGGAADNLGEKIIIPIRKVDTVFAGLKSLGWLHINDSDNVVELLRGASQVIAATKPLITIIVPPAYSISRITDLIALCEQLGLNLYNNRGELIDQLPEQSSITMDMFALAKTEQLEQSFTRLLNQVSPSDYRPDIAVYKEQCDLALASTRSLNSSQFIDFLRGQQQHFSVPSVLAKNVYPLEEYDGVSYNWTGPNTTTAFILPLPSFGQYHLQIKLYAVQDAAKSRSARLFIEGQSSCECELTENSAVEHDFYVSKEDYQGSIVINLSLAGVSHIPESGRHIGVAIEQLSLYWQEN
ncbi:hypothetical protein [Shewanella goraebulensis]|uniref:hypothetical protein n=1 Tax=Shewanella goraebulensis TaxID=3050637 RepID=UPI00254A3D4F|nr:hypothetical protein [Shewanella goraebulensis]